MSRKYEERVERLLTKRGTDRKAAQTDPSHLNKGPRNLKKAQVKKTQREREPGTQTESHDICKLPPAPAGDLILLPLPKGSR